MASKSIDWWTWHFLYFKGSKEGFENVYQRFWKFVQNNPERYIVNSTKDGLKSLLNHNTVYYSTKGQLTEGYNKYAKDQGKIKCYSASDFPQTSTI